MLVNITEYFIESGREWRIGENPDVPREVAARWIADGKATTDVDGVRDAQSSVSWGVAGPATHALPTDYDRRALISVDLAGISASIREHCWVWSSVKAAWYLIGDVLLQSNPSYPDTWNSEIGLWKTTDFVTFTYLGICIQKSGADWGVASAAGAVEYDGRILVPFSHRGASDGSILYIDLAQSGADPDVVPWTRLGHISTPTAAGHGYDDATLVLDAADPALVHLYHRATVPNPTDGVKRHTVLHTSSRTPTNLASWPSAEFFLPRRPDAVIVQELTSVMYWRGAYHMCVMEQEASGTKSAAHWVSNHPTVGWRIADPANPRMTLDERAGLAEYLNGHVSYAVRGGDVFAATWTVSQASGRYGIAGYKHYRRKTGMCKVIAQGTKTCVTDTWVKLDWKTTGGGYDGIGLWDNALSRFVAVDAGTYRVTVTAQLEGTAQVGTMMQLRLTHLGAPTWMAETIDQRFSPIGIYQVYKVQGVGYIDLQAGEFFEIDIFHNAAGSMTARADTANNWAVIERIA